MDRESHIGTEKIFVSSIVGQLALSIELSDNLLKDGKASVVHFSRLRPICSEYIEQLISKFKIVATVEEHLRSGGLGTSVLEAFSDLNIKIRPSVIRFGMPEEFIHDLGSQEYVRTKCGLNIEFMKNKKKLKNQLKTKAAILTEIHKPLEIAEVDLPNIDVGQVRF